ncbi:LuxR C-terminal-related transcriptional regulator, partial [Kitasatospora herbaricolor]
YLKIGATDRTQAALHAQREGLTEEASVAPGAAPEAEKAGAGAAGSAGPVLSEREQNILRQLTLGLSNRLIARNLAISEKTVKNHLSSIYLKIGATDRTQAALHAQRVGLVA